MARLLERPTEAARTAEQISLAPASTVITTGAVAEDITVGQIAGDAQLSMNTASEAVPHASGTTTSTTTGSTLTGLRVGDVTGGSTFSANTSSRLAPAAAPTAVDAALERLQEASESLRQGLSDAAARPTSIPIVTGAVQLPPLSAQSSTTAGATVTGVQIGNVGGGFRLSMDTGSGATEQAEDPGAAHGGGVTPS